MSEELPPIIPVFTTLNFNKDFFVSTDAGLTYQEAKTKFITYPSAQGAVNLQQTTINGILNVNSTSNFANNINLSSNDPNERKITGSFFNLRDINGNANRNTEIYQDSVALVVNNQSTSGKTRFSNKDAAGVTGTVFELETLLGITCFKPFVILANNNLTFNAGTGIINQVGVTNDVSTTNILKRTTITYNNSGNATANPAMEVYESAGRGVYIVPNVLGGAYGPNTQTGDTAFISRHFAMATTSMLFATGTSLRNHLRLLANTDLTACSLVLQNGGNLIGNTSEFRMDYNSTGPTNTMSFNNPINFNPINNGAILSSRRLLTGLGTLSFTDLSGGNSNGIYTSSIYTDSNLVSSLNGMYYDCTIPGAFHQFSVRDPSNNIVTPIYYGQNITSVSNTLIIRSAVTASNRFDILTDNNQNTNMRARSVTASTNAIININCDEVNSLGTVFNRSVLTIAPTYIEVKRPIQFNYTTTPSASNQLGWFNSVNIIGSAYSTQTAPNSMGEIILASGTWKIEANFSFTASGNHTYSVFSYALSSANNTFPTALPYTIAYIQEPGLNINTNTATRQVNLTLQLSSTTSIFLLERVTFTGGGTTNISVNYGITRIG